MSEHEVTPDLSGFRECEVPGWGDWPTRALPDGRFLAVELLLWGAGRLHVARSMYDMGGSSVYDFTSADRAVVEMFMWSGEGEPVGWYRHRPSNRRRPNGDPSKEYVAE